MNYRTHNFTMQEVIHNMEGFTDDLIPIAMYQMGVLQTLRDTATAYFGHPVRINITSGFRNAHYNKFIGGSLTSHHVWRYKPDGSFVCAVDTWSPDVPLAEWFKFCANNIHGEVYMHKIRKFVHIACEQKEDETFTLG